MPDYRRRRRRRHSRRYARFAKKRARRFRSSAVSTGKYLPLTLKNDEPLILKKPVGNEDASGPFVETHFRFTPDLDSVKRQLEPYKKLYKEIKIRGVTITFNPTWNKSAVLRGVRYQCLTDGTTEPVTIKNPHYGLYKILGKQFPQIYRAIYQGNWKQRTKIGETNHAFFLPRRLIPMLFRGDAKRNYLDPSLLYEDIVRSLETIAHKFYYDGTPKVALGDGASTNRTRR